MLFKYSEINNTKKILYVVMLSKEKGVKYLINAVPIILEKLPNVSCDIVGDGPERVRLEKLVKNLGLEGNIKFHGKISHKNMEGYYRRATAVVIPSVCPESFSLVGIEAMSAGRTVIGTSIGAIPEWLEDKKSGFLVEPMNSGEIAEKVLKLFKNRRMLKTMGRRARRRAEQFNLELYIEKLEKLYKEMASNKV